jgi:hypothetical protein
MIIIAQTLTIARYITFIFPVECGPALHFMTDIRTNKYIVSGRAIADLGKLLNLTIEQYFWYQFWMSKFQIIPMNAGHELHIFAHGHKWSVISNYILYNGMLIKPCVKFVVQQGMVAVQMADQSYRTTKLENLVAASMAMDDRVLY